MKPTLDSKTAVWLGNPHEEAKLRPRHKTLGPKRPPSLRSMLRRIKLAARPAHGATARTYLQRVAVRAYQSRQPRSRGVWMAAARYLAREQACPERAGFDAASDHMETQDRMAVWYALGDAYFHKLLISPEAQITVAQMKDLTRGTMAAMERDLGVKLEWMAGVHTNTDNIHAHVTLRAKDWNGRELQLTRDYLYRDLRARAREELTRLIGYRQPERGREIEHNRQYEQTRVPLYERTA